jgi:hypothetical protein
MTANRQRCHNPRFLAVEPLEDRLLLSLAAVNVALTHTFASNRDTAGAAIAQPVAIHSDLRSGQFISGVPDWNRRERSGDQMDAGRTDGRGGVGGDRREHAAIELARIARAEAETGRLLVDPPAVASHEPFNQAPLLAEQENSYLPASLNSHVSVADATSFTLRTPPGPLQPFDAAIAPLEASRYVERAPDVETSGGEQPDAESPVMYAAARNKSVPAVVIPLLNGWPFRLPDARRAVDDFFAHLKGMGTPPSFSWSSLSFGFWMAALGVAAVETARRMRTSDRRRHPLLSTYGWMPDDSLVDEA